ncbi:MAG: hypothetical protein HONBIEJF_02111 [Fimbriimonadaceae bacterium]|nr:hypothetical protein [Fimbriimonadaceae bacterium]
MVLALLAATVLSSQDAQPAASIRILTGREGAKRVYIHTPLKKIEPPKISPKHDWQFEWLVNVLLRPTDQDGEPYRARFRIFSQERKQEGDRAQMVAVMLARLWDFNIQRMRIDHNPAFFHSMVDVYLAWGGKAGGEQLFDEDIEAGNAVRVNTIYIYDLNGFTDPVEMAREIAHEYGHATLPAVGQFDAPETWANGFLGEKLYMSWLAQALADGWLKPSDAMGATAEGLAGYVAKHVDPLIARASEVGPALRLKEKSAAAMDDYIGLALYADLLLPDSAFGRSLTLTGSQAAVDYLRAVADAAAELATWDVKLPTKWKGRSIWIPLPAKGKVTGASAVKRQGNWVQVKVATTKLVVTNPPQADGD